MQSTYLSITTVQTHSDSGSSSDCPHSCSLLTYYKRASALCFLCFFSLSDDELPAFLTRCVEWRDTCLHVLTVTLSVCFLPSRSVEHKRSRKAHSRSKPLRLRLTGLLLHARQAQPSPGPPWHGWRNRILLHPLPKGVSFAIVAGPQIRLTFLPEGYFGSWRAPKSQVSTRIYSSLFCTTLLYLYLDPFLSSSVLASLSSPQSIFLVDSSQFP